METRTKMGFFNPRRFGQLLLRDVAGGYRGWLIAAAAVAGTVIVLSALTVLGISRGENIRFNGASNFHVGFYIQLLLLGGFISTSFAFREVRQNGAGIFYMTLPASQFEKLASKLLVSSVGYVLGSLVFYTATAAVSEGINRLIFGAGHGFFNPFDPTILRAAGMYLLAQSIFLLGSIWFKKLAFVRTVLWLSVFAIGAVVVTAVAARIILAGHFVPSMVQAGAERIGGWSLNLGNDFLMSRFGPGSPGSTGLTIFKTIAEVLLFGALAPVCWLAAYFRLRETEV
jgi:hypothetical protein